MNLLVNIPVDLSLVAVELEFYIILPLVDQMLETVVVLPRFMVQGCDKIYYSLACLYNMSILRMER